MAEDKAPILTNEEYAKVVKQVPLPGVDIMPYTFKDGVLHYGLIKRLDLHGNELWNLVGGRMQFNQTIRECVSSHLIEDLGEKIRFHTGDLSKPVFVSEYVPKLSNLGVLTETRKHQVSLNYVIRVEGKIIKNKDTLDFVWREITDAPDFAEIGFNQWEIVEGLRQRLLEIYPEQA